MSLIRMVTSYKRMGLLSRPDNYLLETDFCAIIRIQNIKTLLKMVKWNTGRSKRESALQRPFYSTGYRDIPDKEAELQHTEEFSLQE